MSGILFVLEHIKGKELMHWKNGLEMRWLKKIGTYVLNWNELFKFFNSVSLNRPEWSRDNIAPIKLRHLSDDLWLV